MTTEYVIRIVLAIVLGAMIGAQREYHAKDAGVRTHFLVALGSALFMVVSQFGFNEPLVLLDGGAIRLDPSRMAAQVVSGIGFIGAGTIIFQRNVVRGLTTAAGLWVTAAIGITCGAGMYVLATVSTLLVIVCLETVNHLHFLGAGRLAIIFTTTRKENLNAATNLLRKHSTRILSFEIHNKGTVDDPLYEARTEINTKHHTGSIKIYEALSQMNDINVVSIE